MANDVKISRELFLDIYRLLTMLHPLHTHLKTDPEGICTIYNRVDKEIQAKLNALVLREQYSKRLKAQTVLDE